MTIGVLALQGDFAEHLQVLYQLGVETREVRLPAHLENLAGLILPGGESTTIGKLASNFGLVEPLRHFADGHPVWGTCAGAIFLAKNIHNQKPFLGLMDITVQRNAFGRQVDSFEADLKIPVLQESDRPFRAIFIRAPIIERVCKNVDVLARLEDKEVPKNGRIVAARQQNLLVSSFHPELTQDTRFHQYFLSMVEET